MSSSSSRKIPFGDINQSKMDGTLDPLFDYSKTQPPIAFLDDDNEEDVQILASSKPHTSGRPPTSKSLEANSKENFPVQGHEADNVMSENDWLEPPPKPGNHKALLGNPTLRKLRQEKQELQRIWQASEASVKKTEESLKLAAQATVPLSREQAGGGIGINARSQNADSGQAPSKRQKILLKLQGQTGDSEAVRIYVDDKLEKLFTHYANNIGKRPKAEFVFCFDGQQLSANSSPKDLDLEDEDIVEVFVKKAQS